MGMNTHIVGIVAPNQAWKNMKAVYESCIEAGVKIPEEVDRFFNGEPPDDSGVVINIENAAVVEKWGEDMKDGFVVDLKLLRTMSPNLTHIRFYNSY